VWDIRLPASLPGSLGVSYSPSRAQFWAQWGTTSKPGNGGCEPVRSRAEVRAEHPVSFSHPVALHVLTFHFPWHAGPVGPSAYDMLYNTI
jgi:hypothetical protein